MVVEVLPSKLVRQHFAPLIESQDWSAIKAALDDTWTMAKRLTGPFMRDEITYVNRLLDNERERFPDWLKDEDYVAWLELYGVDERGHERALGHRHNQCVELQEVATTTTTTTTTSPVSNDGQVHTNGQVHKGGQVGVRARRYAFTLGRLIEDEECERCGSCLHEGTLAWTRPDWPTRRKSNGHLEPLVVCESCHSAKSSERTVKGSSRILAAVSLSGATAVELATATGMKPRTLRRHVRQLVADGHLVREGAPCSSATRYFKLDTVKGDG